MLRIWLWSSVPLLLAGGAVAQAPVRVADPAPLFASDTTLQLTLTSDFRSLLRERNRETAEYHPATLGYVGAGGTTVEIPVEVRTRGNFRLASRTCDFPPLRIRFPKSTGEALFAGQDRLKLVVTCRRGSDSYEQYVLREYAVYRAYNAVTPVSFRVRLARIRYVDTGERLEPFVRAAFFLESEAGLAARHGGTIVDVQGARKEHLDPGERDVHALFEYMVGNTDWSISGLHNIRLLQAPPLSLFAVPYDFDWAGAVDAPYAFPDPSLPIGHVRERIFRAHCLTMDELHAAIEHFLRRREAVYGAVEVEGVEERDAGRMRSYLDEFYEELEDPEKLDRKFARSCFGDR